MALGFKSPRIQTKSSKALIIANATAITEQMQSFFSEIKDPRVPRIRAQKRSHPTKSTQRIWIDPPSAIEYH